MLYILYVLLVASLLVGPPLFMRALQRNSKWGIMSWGTLPPLVTGCAYYLIMRGARHRLMATVLALVIGFVGGGVLFFIAAARGRANTIAGRTGPDQSANQRPRS